ncbi:MAG: hypothetical protein Q8867_08345 [Bacteroidota bacterium]|nr:hypothetical protein [Bacteroidota bacterium]
MKIKFFWVKDFLRIVGLSAIFTLFLSYSGFTQDQGAKPDDQKQAVRIKVLTRDNGKVTVLDTVVKGDYSGLDMEKYLKDYESKMKDFEKGMKELEIRMQSMPLPDSTMIDSLGKMRFDFGFFRNDKGRPGHGNRHPRDFSFDMPELPELPDLPDLSDFPDFNMNPGMPFPPDSPDRELKGGKHDLSEILGDIPMDNIKSYKVKDIKGGKRIIIDVDASPMFKPSHHDVIIIHDRSARRQNGRPPMMRKMEKRVMNHKDTPGPQGEVPPDVR